MPARTPAKASTTPATDPVVADFDAKLAPIYAASPTTESPVFKEQAEAQQALTALHEHRVRLAAIIGEYFQLLEDIDTSIVEKVLLAEKREFRLPEMAGLNIEAMKRHYDARHPKTAGELPQADSADSPDTPAEEPQADPDSGSRKGSRRLGRRS